MKTVQYYIKQGQEKFKVADYTGALKAFKLALTLEPKNAYVLRECGESARILGDYQEALRHLDASLEINSRDAFALRSRGAVMRQLGCYEAALKDLDASLKIGYKNTLALNERGEMKRMLGRYEEALKDLDASLEIEPKNAFALRSRGAVKRQLGRDEAALKDLDASLEIEPKNTFALKQQEEIKQLLKHYHDEVLRLDQILMSEPTNVLAFRKRGAAKLALGYYHAAIADCVQALDTNFNDVEAMKIRDQAQQQLTSFNILPNQITLGAKLGEGSFGIVYKAQYHYGDVAVKQLKTASMFSWSSQSVEAFKQEIVIMAQLRSPNIVQFYGVCTDSSPYSLVMEYLPKGSLYSVLRSPEPLPWSQRETIALDIAKGLAYLHHRFILHRDLRSSNVLMDATLHAKLTDFGLAALKTELRNFNSMKQKVELLSWMAPELFKQHAEYNNKTDIYSYGMTVWEITSGKIPFADAHNPEMIPSWVSNNKREAIPESTPPKLAQLIRWCWEGKPDKRPTIEEIIQYLQADTTVATDSTSASDEDKAKGAASLKAVNNTLNPMLTQSFLRKK